MKTKIDEIADGIHRISTCVADAAPGGFTFNQFLVVADEPLLYHTGPKAMFPLVSKAVSSILPLSSLRWITFSHVESDECGAMNEFLEAAPEAQVAHGAVGCMTSLNDLCLRPPRVLDDGEVLDLGGKKVMHIDTPHVPHNWESRVLFEQTTRTLLCGDILTHLGDGPAVTEDDVVEDALAAEAMFGAMVRSRQMVSTLRDLAGLEPRCLAIMHGSSYVGDGGAALRRLAGAVEEQLAAASGG